MRRTSRRILKSYLPATALFLLLSGCRQGPFYPFPSYTELLPADPLYHYQWGMSLLRVGGAWGLLEASTVHPPPAKITGVVAIIDSGLAAGHPDLVGRLTGDGYDLVADAPIPLGNEEPAGSVEHGTHTAGIIVAGGTNGLGTVGIGGIGFYPGHEVRVTPLKVLTDATSVGYSAGSFDDLATALLYAAGVENDTGRTPAIPASVINMSLGAEVTAVSEWQSAFLEAACIAAARTGAILISAAGNGDLSGSGIDGGIDIPAVYDSVVAVGSVDGDSTRSVFSDFGPELELMAPGGTSLPEDGTITVLSTGLPGIDPDGYGPGYALAEGTSVSTSFVSGAAALISIANPYLPGGTIRRILQETARDLGSPGWDGETGFGLVDVEAAVAVALSRPYGPFEPRKASRAYTSGLSAQLRDLGASLRSSADHTSNPEDGSAPSVWRGSTTTGADAGVTVDSLLLVFDPEAKADYRRLRDLGIRIPEASPFITSAALVAPILLSELPVLRSTVLQDPAVLIVAANGEFRR